MNDDVTIIITAMLVRVQWAELQFVCTCLTGGGGLSLQPTSPAAEHGQRDARTSQDQEDNGDDQRCDGGT